MGMELAYVAISRAPYTAHLHTCLIVAALAADHRDILKMSHAALAWQARISRRKAQEAFQRFEADGFMVRLRFDQKKHPHAIWFQVRRDVLFSLPRRGALVTGEVPPRKVVGKFAPNEEKRIRATINAAARDSAARILDFQQLTDQQRMVYLRNLRPKM